MTIFEMMPQEKATVGDSCISMYKSFFKNLLHTYYPNLLTHYLLKKKSVLYFFTHKNSLVVILTSCSGLSLVVRV